MTENAESIRDVPMISYRQKRLYQLDQKIWIMGLLWLGITYMVFSLYWVWFLSPVETVLVASVIPFVILGIAFFYERRGIKREIKRLEKYAVIFNDFFEAMIADMDANEEEKNDTWLTIDLQELVDLRELKRLTLTAPLTTNINELVKLSNYNAMIYLRRKLEMKA